ncbi:MAG: hypothetical protein WAS05_03600 [Candidatus Nanopelagicales bacterium]
MKSLRLTGIAAVATIGVLALGACSSSSDSTRQSSASPSPSVSYKQLNQDQLVATLVDLKALPNGFAVDDTLTKPGNVSYLCDYDKNANLPQLNTYAARDFSKGTGLQADVVRTGIRQYDSVEVSAKFFDALDQALKTCKETTQDGQTGKVSVVSADQVGDRSVMVKLDFKEVSLYTQYIQVGPSFIQVGNASMMGVNPDVTVDVAKKQVAKYQEAARG